MSVLVFVEVSKGAPAGSSLEVLGKARILAQELGTEVAAALLGAGLDSAASAVAPYADSIYVVDDPVLADYRLSAWSVGLMSAIAESAATVVLAPATTRGRELAAYTAAELEAGFAPDVIDLRVEDGKIVAVRSIYSNNILADVRFNSDTDFVTVRPRSFAPAEAGAAGKIVNVPLGIGEEAVAETVMEFRSTDTGEVNLTDARIIVSGGRGVAADPEKGFQLVGELADTLGAAVGASRAAVDAGYIPYKHQVGQTGKTVRPDLYIAAGISGAIQHLAGMAGSKVIVAINKDKDAPIFERASYAIVGDLYEVLPALNEEFKKRLG